MARKKKEVVKVVVPESETPRWDQMSSTAELPTHVVVKRIEPLSVDFNREDLNIMARKINELINHVNHG